MMAVRRIRAERSPNRAARLRQEHNTLLARMPPDTMCTGLARAAARGIQACGKTVADFFGRDHARRRGTRARRGLVVQPAGVVLCIESNSPSSHPLESKHCLIQEPGAVDDVPF